MSSTSVFAFALHYLRRI